MKPNEAGISRQVYTKWKPNRHSFSCTLLWRLWDDVARRIRKIVAHRMPESANALWRIVSLTAAKTRRIFDVSVACVRL